MRDRRRLHKTFSRAVSLLLGLLLCLEPLSVVALAATSGERPAVKTTYKPTVVVEGNAVVTGVAEGDTPTDDDLTGFFEVALKVQTAAYVDGGGKQVSYETYAADPDSYEKKDDIDFGMVAATLKYDADIFTPVSWSATEKIFVPESGDVNPLADGVTDIAGATTTDYVSLDSIGPEEMIYGDARVRQSENDASQYILYMSAQAIHENVRYDEPTAVVVVRFAYNKSQYPMLTTDDESGDYVLGVDNPKTDTVLWLATDPEAAAGYNDQSVWYDGNYYDAAGALTERKVTHYYYLAAESTTPTIGDPISVDYVDKNGADKTATGVDNPNTTGKKVLSLDYADSAAEPNYLDNVLKQSLDGGDYASLDFNFVNAASFLTSGVNVDDVAPILFYDWDDTLLGVLVVEKGKDVRAEVNAFVSQWIHPQITAAPAVSSLSRADNYRGKYPTTPMTEDAGASDPTVDSNGGNYPLTNKLDYVFFKRPMEPVLDATTSDPIPNQWQQMSADDGSGAGATATWDEEYPYVYGWANCVDPTMVEATWTTLGSTGELNNYAVNDTTGVATFTYDSDDVKFTFADFKTGVEGPTYVKAVYEPGDDLLSSSYSYRMSREPYYNKLNSAAASGGGAYSVSMYFERAYVDAVATNGILYGVARFRDPYVRQDTTTDLRWEENADLGIDNNLPNATTDEAAGKTKTTYTRVVMENAEEFEVALALSARQNKVDYFLVEGHGSNFVAGGQRSAPNSSYANTSAFVVDNYNYRVDNQSNETDAYHDVIRFDEKEGTHGFVLYGTLNYVMQIATQYSNGEIDMTGAMQKILVGDLTDINIRDKQGGPATTQNRVTLIAELGAAAGAAATHKGDAAYDCWNEDLDCAELSYHQLQLYIMNGTLLQRATADKTPITWCRLHATCAALTSGKPTDWDELIVAVSEKTADELKELLTFVEMDTMAGLRSNTEGDRYTSADDLLADLEVAVKALSGMGVDAPDWDMIQGYILDNTVANADDAAQKSYDAAWWYNGGTEVTNFASVLAAADYANNTNPKRKARLNTLRDEYEAAQLNVTNNADWNSRTDNLMMGETTTTTEKGETVPAPLFFSYDFDTFVDKLMAAEAALGTSAEEANWRAIQYHLINGTYPKADDADAQAQMASYWWYKNGQPIYDLPSMLEAAAAKNSAWQNFTVDDLTGELYFAKEFDGTSWEEADFATFKSLVEQLADDTALTWYQVQYRIVHRTDDTAPATTVLGGVAEDEGKAYYWWINGTLKESLKPLGHTTTAVQHGTPDRAKVDDLVNLAFRVKYNGIPNTIHGLTTEILTAYRFQYKVPGADVADYTANLFTEAMVGDMLTKLAALVAEANENGNGDKFTPPTLTWYQVQYALLHDGKYLAAPEDGLTGWGDYDAGERYWWRLVDNNPNNTSVKTKFDDLLGYMYQFSLDPDNKVLGDIIASGSGGTFKNFLGESEVNLKRNNNGNVISSNTHQTTAKKNLTTLVNTIIASHRDLIDAANQTIKLTWPQVQYAVINGGTYVDEDAAYDAYVNVAYDWAPDWYKNSVASASVMSLRPTVYEDQYTSETTVSEDGLTTTVVENLGTWNDELGDYDWTITTTVTQQVGETTVTTITVTTMTYDPETWQPVFDTTTETRVSDAETGDATYGLEEDTDLTPVQPSDEADDQTPEESDPAADETQSSTGGDQTYQPGADTVTTPVETADESDAESEADDEVESETGALSAASAGLLSLAWRTGGTGPGISLATAGPVSSLRVTGILDTGQLFGSQRDGPLGILPSRSNLPTVAALMANRRI